MAGFIAVAASLKPTKGLCWVFSAVFLIFLDATEIDNNNKRVKVLHTADASIFIQSPDHVFLVHNI